MNKIFYSFVVYSAVLSVFTAHAHGSTCKEALQSENLDSKSPFEKPFPSLELAPVNQKNYSQARSLKRRNEVAEGQSYEYMLSDGFIDYLFSLRSDQIYLDGGAGAMRAMADYVSLKKDSAKVIGIVSEISKDTRYIQQLMKQKSPSEMALFFDKKVEDVDTIIPNSISLITDVYGAFSYTDRPDLVLKKYLTWLKVGGRIYIHQEYYSKGLSVAYRVKTEKRKYLGLVKTGETILEWQWFKAGGWLGGIKGVRFVQQHDSTFYLEKIDTDVHIPELKLTHLENDFPPRRHYHATGRYLEMNN